MCKELELTRLAKNELEKLSETREKQVVELERKLALAETDIQKLTDKGKLQRTESDWMLQKEKQIKQVHLIARLCLCLYFRSVPRGC